MGNQRTGNCPTQVTSTSPKVSKVATIEIQRQPVGLKVIRPLRSILPITRVEIVVAPTTNFYQKWNIQLDL